ncbi:nucleotide-diphospho-sugar transferase [Neocallimastix lanati (nom. inval.)]|uniref:Nucleotide-diphospho-sugar transferase n=1 Tax=Neocallimastix californiae TaxID=1754190 RepID=A0A1Y1ZUN8_9FUNG|nr:nucleotide-diphospho-sugar transferase [Neocallimastix sp. JGI-2020a]ORY13777.1 nucleotide-diphospho-sugar transferase [Neocallimastix californiae]|eukprot:ORY13777.1 nucleotide-diphospho-sugar transferase [Neocallimastix californiae]
MNLLISVFLFILLFLEIFVKYIYALPLSIVVPVYNTASYLDRCINSILNQIFKDFKLICVDDGSTDNSMEILEKFKMTDNKVKIIHSEKNNGASVQETQELKMQKENLLDLLISVYDSIWREKFLNDNNIRYNEKMKKGNDYAFNVLAYKYKPRVLKLPDEGIYYYYKRRTGSIRNFSEGSLKIIIFLTLSSVCFIYFFNLLSLSIVVSNIGLTVLTD